MVDADCHFLWLCSTVLALQVFEYFQPLVTVFVLAALLAFILNYPVQFLQNAK